MHRFSSLSFRTLGLIFVLWLYGFNYYKRWESYHLIQWDILQYYSYLPAAFYHHDLSFKFVQEEPWNSHWQLLWLNDTGSGAKVIKMTVGLSFLYLPFFLIAHFLAGWLGYTQDGFSDPYQILLALSAIFYALIGLIYLRRCLLLYFSEGITSLVLLAICLGTNLWAGILLEPGMAHPYLFMLFAMVLWYSIKWSRSPGWMLSGILGLLIGLIILIRPTNVLILFIPVLIHVSSITELRDRFRLFRNHWGHIVVLFACAGLVLLPQMIHWKYLTGQWVLYSYGNEGFYFLKPHLLSCLFSYRKGWLLYTPIMLLALIGIFLLYKKARPLAWLVSLFIPVNIWIVTSWWCWWYGGCFSMRPMIESYVLLSFSLASLFAWALSMKIGLFKWTLGAMMAGCIWLNIFQSFQYHKGILHFDSMSKALYRSIWGSTVFPENYIDMMRAPDVEQGGWEEDEKIEKF